MPRSSPCASLLLSAWCIPRLVRSCASPTYRGPVDPANRAPAPSDSSEIGMLSTVRWTLSRKLMLALVTLVVVPFVGVQSLYYWDTYQRDRQDALDIDREIAEAAANAIETRLSDAALIQ